MFKLPVRTWILNAAAVLSGQQGAVTRQAQDADCSRETVYQHARKLEQRLASQPDSEAALAELHGENQRLRERIAELEREANDRVRCDKAQQRQLATTAFAMGLSLRQIEELLGHLLPPDKVPDHSTLGHWIEAQTEKAGQVLEVLDRASAPRVRSLAIDEIFFGGDRLWLGSSRPA
jgi:hypothetical protein